MANLDVTNDANLTTATTLSRTADRLLLVQGGSLKDIAPGVLIDEGRNGEWLEVSDTWTYASATTITVPSDATVKYQKGMKIRLKQGGSYKYFYAAAVASTLLTVTGGSDYTVANAAITDVAFSFSQNPLGFPTGFTYSSGMSGGGGSAGAFAESVAMSRFSIEGKRCFINIQKQITNKGSWTGAVAIAIPVNASSAFAAGIHMQPAVWASGGAPNAPKAWAALYTSGISFLDLLNSSFFEWTELAVNDTVVIHINYEI